MVQALQTKAAVTRKTFLMPCFATLAKNLSTTTPPPTLKRNEKQNKKAKQGKAGRSALQVQALRVLQHFLITSFYF
jgi:hypothetical protein